MKEKEGWEHEQEMRMFLGNIPITYPSEKIEYCANGYKVHFPKDAVKRIIIGYNMDEQNIKRIDDIRRMYNLPNLYVIQPSNTPFNLEFAIKKVD